MIVGPFAAMTGHSMQNTPMGDSFRIISMHFIKISLRSLNAFTTRIFFSPTRIMAKPRRMAITMICSIFASTMGDTKFDGKIFTIVSIKEVASAASYVRSVVATTGKSPLKRFPAVSPMVTAKAVVQR